MELISRKAVEKIIKEFFKTKVDEIPKREKFNKLCDLCDLYLELNANLHKEIEDIPVAYDVDKVVEQLETYKNIMQSNMESSGHDGMAREYYRGRKSAAIDFLEIIGRSCQG